ncbi:unnamed protein product [Auanema sp. JU1783]|nr:unnamed protein product [Auanema sp. JU1783]
MNQNVTESDLRDEFKNIKKQFFVPVVVILSIVLLYCILKVIRLCCSSKRSFGGYVKLFLGEQDNQTAENDAENAERDEHDVNSEIEFYPEPPPRYEQLFSNDSACPPPLYQSSNPNDRIRSQTSDNTREAMQTQLSSTSVIPLRYNAQSLPAETPVTRQIYITGGVRSNIGSSNGNLPDGAFGTSVPPVVLKPQDDDIRIRSETVLSSRETDR